MCLNCILSFLNNPTNKIIILISIFFAISLLIFFVTQRKKLTNLKKVGILYAFAFFTIFPFAFYFYAKTCQTTFFQLSILQTGLLSCNSFESVVNSSGITIFLSSIISFTLVPFIFKFSSKNIIVKEQHQLFQKVKKYAKKLQIKMPTIYIIDKSEPIAYSITHIKPSIFITVGLLDLLKPKESQAVILHELGHIKQKSSIFKFTNSLFRFLTPLSNFNILHSELSQEEKDADRVAIEYQKTEKHLFLAKEKIEDYYLKKKSMNKN